MSDLNAFALIFSVFGLVVNVMYALMLIAKYHATLVVEKSVKGSAEFVFVVVVLPGLFAGLLAANIVR